MESRIHSPQAAQSKAYSCVRCFERKVKCDKQHPCAGCRRSQVECVFRVRKPPRRRQRQVIDEGVLLRLMHYEDLLRKNGIDLNSPSAPLNKVDTDSPHPDVDHATPSTSRTTNLSPASYGRLIGDHGRSRFVEKYALFPCLGLSS